MSDLAQLSGAKELHSLFSYSFIIYDYANDTEVDLWYANLFQDHLVHYLLISKL
jgi:hypothetical protein